MKARSLMLSIVLFGSDGEHPDIGNPSAVNTVIIASTNISRHVKVKEDILYESKESLAGRLFHCHSRYGKETSLVVSVPLT